MKDRLSRLEWITAGFLSLIAVGLHILAAASAGALWRDEANTVGLATLPSLRDVWANLQYDSFPAAWIFFVRVVATAAGPMNDAAFRVVGLAIGLTVLAMLWINARVFRYEAPLLSLAMLGLNSSVVRWGDSLRAYGAGMALAILIGIMIWRVVQEPKTPRLILAALSAIAGVQILYYDAPVVLSFCVGAVAVLLAQRNYRAVFSVFGVGAIAAVSLLIYLPVIRGAARWNSLATVPTYGVSWFALKLDEAISPLGGAATFAWVLVVSLAVCWCVRQFVQQPAALSEEDRNKLRFAIFTLVAIVLSHFAFLKTLSYLTQPWYYLTLLAVTAVTVDIISGTLVITVRMRVARLVLTVAVAGLTAIPTIRYVTMRMTNVDSAAKWITEKARSDDLVLIVPWYDGVSFARYYRGKAPIMTVPEMSFHEFHRYDLVSVEMQKKDQMDVVRNSLDRIRSILIGGRTIFLVSHRRVWTQNMPVTLLPAARIPLDGWKSPEYDIQWSAIVGSDLKKHAVSISALDLNRGMAVGGYENLYLTVVRGWRE